MMRLATAADAMVDRRFPEDFSDAEVDELEALEEEILLLAAQLNAGSQRLLTLIAAFDAKGGWKASGHRSCAHWLAFHTGVDVGPAREQVRVARALVALPETSAAMARGELSFSAVQEITRVADRQNETDLVAYARSTTVAELRRLIRSWRRGPRAGELDRERVLHASRRFAVVPDGDGMYVVCGRLTPEVAAVLMRAVEAASDALYRAGDGVEPAQRRADALGLLAERALAAGFDAPMDEAAGFDAPMDEAAVPAAHAISHAPMGRAPAEGAVCAEGVTRPAAPPCCGSGRRTPLSGSRAERYQVVIHVEPETLRADGAGGRSELDDGTRLAAETARRFACDAGVVRVVRGSDGSVLDVGRRTRTIPPALRRALELRDRGCRFPGCGLAFTEAHHIVPWADGGATSLANCVLLCRYHHRLLHEEGFTLRIIRGRYLFLGRDGMPVPDKPPTLNGGADPLGALLRENRRGGVEPTYRTCTPRYRRAGDIPLAVLLKAAAAAVG
jgi:hypothetical protein